MFHVPGMSRATPNTICLIGAGVGQVDQAKVDEVCRQLCIAGGFSVHDSVRVVHPSLIQVEFPFSEAAAQFSEYTNGSLQVYGRTLMVQHPLAGAAAPVAAAAPPASGDAAATPAAEAIEPPEPTAPSDTLLVKRIGEATEADVRDAFAEWAARIRDIKMPKTFSGKSKGHAFVRFHKEYEASTALRLLSSTKIEVAGNRVFLEYAPPQTFEETVERELQKRRKEEEQQQQHAQALSGPNAGMWASYLALFDDGAQAAKRQRLGMV